MKVKIKYTAQLKKSLGKGEEVIEINEGISVKELLKELFQENKEAFLNIVFNAEGDFTDSVLLILNGQQIDFEHPERIKENDEVLIMSPIAGG